MTFDFSDFSKYRTQLMGISILLIMMFHVGFFKCGYIGVEFFLLISAIGLFFSLSKDQRLIPFYKKRLIRILPAYFIVAIPTFIYLQGGNFDFGQLLYDLAGLYILDSHRYLWFVHFHHLLFNCSFLFQVNELQILHICAIHSFNCFLLFSNAI